MFFEVRPDIFQRMERKNNRLDLVKCQIRVDSEAVVNGKGKNRIPRELSVNCILDYSKKD